MKDILGLLVLAWPLTLLVLIGITFLVVVPLAVRYAAKHGRSKWCWGIGAFLLVYLPIFWDWIPTLVVHKYYCEKEAGFWVYKTLDRWKEENPGVMEGLVANKGYPSSREGDMVNYTTTIFLNSHFNLVVKHRGPLFLHRWLREDTLIDSRTNKILARFIDFSTSQERRQAGWSGWKFWLDSRNCIGGLDKAIESGNFMNQFKGAEK